MYRAIVKIRGTAPMSQSRQHYAKKLEGESNEDYDNRTWREKCNYDPETNEVFVPAMAFKQAMDTAAQRLSIKDPDNARATMTKYFVSEVICERNLYIGISKDEISCIKISANVDGVRGSGKRVPRILPQVQEWEGETSFLIMDPKIKKEMFEKVLETAGRSIGIGQFRPEKGGLNGRFEIADIDYEDV